MRYSWLRKLSYALPAETAHALGLLCLKTGLIASPLAESTFQPEIFGKKLANPLGIAAGLDKNGIAIAGALKLGVGAVEIGGVTPLPQPGNPKPRLFRLPKDEALINAFGFNNHGMQVISTRLRHFREKKGWPAQQIVGVNLGKNKNSTDAIEDFDQLLRCFADLADYLVINLSSPNTKGLRDLQSSQFVEEMMVKLNKTRQHTRRRPPVLLKLSPDLEQNNLESVIEAACSQAVDGFVLGNTTTNRPDLHDKNRHRPGGLSGKPLAPYSHELLRRAAPLVAGRVPLIACGGISTGQDVRARLDLGATLIQFYTALIYQGPSLIRTFLQDL